jgi:hypothetical protein
MKLIQERRSWDDSILEPILEKLSTIASEATTIGSTVVHPMTIKNINYGSAQSSTSLSTRLTQSGSITIGRDLRLVEKTTRRFLTLKQSNKAEVIKVVILELCHRDKT